jgi:5-(carboxyamino)imidazole ribonucleotide synthase
MDTKIGILGGGQLGKMLIQAGSRLGLDITLMDKSKASPGGLVCPSFVIGDITDHDDVMRFGSTYDVVSIEIERVNTEALAKLEQSSVHVYPQPHLISLIQDKGLQKQFYEDHGFESSKFKNYENIQELLTDIDSGIWSYPFIQKARTGGYDGRGVQSISSKDKLTQEGFKTNFLIEDKVDIDKEIAIISCRSSIGEIVTYDPVEMVFDKEQNILSYQQCPANITAKQLQQVKALAHRLTEKLQIVGLLAIELFLTKSGAILINEVAPRPHNSGHHTIESTICSQYENHLRAILGLPLGSTELTHQSVLMNLLGEPESNGPVVYEGLQETLSISGVYPHIYGKTDTKPFRKMGHVTIVGDNMRDIIAKYEHVKSILRAQSK